MSFNLSLNTTQEAFFVFTSLMFAHQHRVMVVGFRTYDGERKFVAEFTKTGSELIECHFNYSQTSDTLRVEWFNTNTKRKGKITMIGVFSKAGDWSDFRPMMHAIFEQAATASV